MLDEYEISAVLKEKVKKMPEMVVVLGSGWREVLSGVKSEVEVGFGEVFGVETSVPGHEGRLVVAKVSGKRVMFVAGRLHMYEGYSAREVTAPIRALHKAGMKKLVLTSAAGAINEKFGVGEIVVQSDLLTVFLALDNPLKGPAFTDMSEVFDREMRSVAIKVCAKEEIGFREGIYCYYHGPNFETPADKMALKILGADCVGMSTVPEAIQARALGVRTLGLSFITNLAFVKHDHKEVLAEAKKGSGRMVALLKGVIAGV